MDNSRRGDNMVGVPSVSTIEVGDSQAVIVEQELHLMSLLHRLFLLEVWMNSASLSSSEESEEETDRIGETLNGKEPEDLSAVLETAVVLCLLDVRRFRRL